MSDRLRVSDYLAGAEDVRHRELVWGVVREPPAPKFGHQSVVTRTTVLLDLHVRGLGLGVVCVAPVDVVLDEAKALIVQPDVVFVSTERAHIVRDQIWGAPDLVVEVASRASARRDRTIKLDWYREYGVRECWLVEPGRRAVTVVDLSAGRAGDRRRLTGADRVRSSVLPGFVAPAERFFT